MKQTPDLAIVTPISSTVPLTMWLLVQIGAIAIAAYRVPLWPHAPEAGEFLSADILLIVQILFATFLSPRICCNWRSAAMAIACAWPFAALAGILAAKSGGTIVRSGAYVSGWIAVLWIWSLAFPSRKGRFVVSAIASTWSAAGPILIFIGGEYAATPFYPKAPYITLSFGPVVNGLMAIRANFSNFDGGWAILAGCGFLGIVAFLMKAAIISRFSADLRCVSAILKPK